MKAPGNEAQAKAIADANAALNNVDLPNYSELLAQICQQNEKLEKLVIQVEVKTVYGVDKIYPANQAAEILAKIAGTKTLNNTDCALAAALGFTVEEVVSDKLRGVYFPALQKAAGVVKL